jgi:hypothetical protein
MKRKDMPYVVVQDCGTIVWSTLAPWPPGADTDVFLLHVAHAWGITSCGAKGACSPHKGWRKISKEEWEAGR